MIWEIPGYTSIRLIAIGLHSILLSAKRESDNLRVILKVAKKKSDYSSIEHEYRMMKRISGFQTIPRLYALVKNDELCCIEMEEIDSPTVAALIEKRKNLSVEEFLPFALAAVQALESVHRFSIIHKDFNPFNLLYDLEKRECKVIDFGLSVPIDRQKAVLLKPGLIEGTLAYISPEQTGRMNRGIDYRSDYYSLGVTLYQALTGSLPFFSSDPLEMIHAHIAILPRPPHTIDPSLPPVLSDLIMKLLWKEPDSRYQSIVGLRSDLLECQKRLRERYIAPFALAQSDTRERFQIPEKIYGRSEEIERLISLYKSTMEGGSHFMLIGGYSGVGKSSLVRELLKPVSDREGRMVSGKYDQFKRNIPYFALSQALDEYIKEVSTEGAESFKNFRERVVEALGNSGKLITDAIPSLEAVIGKQSPLSDVGAEEAQNRFAYFFERFIKWVRPK